MGQSSAFDSPVLTIKRQDAVATVWLDRPEARNAMGQDLWRDLPLAMQAVAHDAHAVEPMCAVPLRLGRLQAPALERPARDARGHDGDALEEPAVAHG